MPALVELLANEPLAHYAREALEAMATAEADAALRAALGKAQGAQLIGVVNSLGMRRDTAAVPALRKIGNDGNSPAAVAALLALGRIGTGDARAAVESALARGSADVRAAAAEAALLVADGLLARGEKAEAARWFERVRVADAPVQARLSALRGVLLSREAGALPLLLESLRSANASERAVAVRAIRDLQSPEVTPALAKEIEQFAPEVQALVIGAWTDRGDERALPTIERLTGAEEIVRVAALRALGKMGKGSSVPLLLRAAMQRPPESDAAQRSLAQLQVPGVEEAILKAAEDVKVPTIRVALIGILGERRATKVTPRMLQWARDAEPAVSRSALRALALLARPADLPQLIALALALREDEARTLADRAIYATAMKILEPEKRAEPLLQAVREAKEPATRAMLLRPLGAVVRAMGGSAAAQDAVIALLHDRDAGVRTAAVKCLANWPDASPAMALLPIATGQGAAAREAAFDGVARMVTDVAAGRDKTSLDVVSCVTSLDAAVKSDQERMKIVSTLGAVRRIEAHRMLVPYLDMLAVRTEAALAVVQIAPALLGGKDGAEVRATLQRIAETEQDADVRARAKRVLQGGAPAGAGKKGKAKKA